MADIFDAYPMSEAWDEMFERPGQPRAPADLRYRAEALARVFTDRGVTFAYVGEECSFLFDLVFRIIDVVEWDLLIRAVRQRVRALEAFLADVYDSGRVLADGVVPSRLVVTSAHFWRQAHGIVPPNGVRVHVSGVDLVRDERGHFRVLEDNLRIPSGVSYVIENRRAMTQTMPALRGLLRARAARPVDGRGAGGGARPALHRQPGADAYHARRAPGASGVPPGRRRVHRPAAFPTRLGHRLPGHRERGPRRARTRPDPLLPGRGAAGGQRRDPPPRRSRRPGPARRAGAQAG